MWRDVESSGVCRDISRAVLIMACSRLVDQATSLGWTAVSRDVPVSEFLPTCCTLWENIANRWNFIIIVLLRGSILSCLTGKCENSSNLPSSGRMRCVEATAILKVKLYAYPLNCHGGQSKVRLSRFLDRLLTA